VNLTTKRLLASRALIESKQTNAVIGHKIACRLSMFDELPRDGQL
jgi:hypothetical protein